ncbi:hypothetical protein MFM001_05310 [Mycobacterium sp. MFM001]|uniref:hypothetical protein n=1 Tax=Mycobacterium sp. MFM001 TaxID=2049453 RepID=UPI000DA5ADA0|nr:hypothetical protein [Mycobacterium sp. MFM001]GBE64069.1 hypothetical protein MFM001_05310 [Mycobacterium sp. MFM001]
MTALAITTIVIVAGTLTIMWRKRAEDTAARSAWQPPAQTFLEASMRVPPIPGWRTRITDLGLPASAPDVAGRSMIATNDDAFESNPFVGNLGKDAYFVASSPGAPDPQWWLVGINVRDGRSLFPAVRLSAEMRAPKCFLNGPTNVLCLRKDIKNITAWVVDARSGRVSYTGPTDLRTTPPRLNVYQVGTYTVASTEGQGVYGVGPHAETTWFVPGNGHVDQRYASPRDTENLLLASQTTRGRGSDGEVVFSLRDGAVIRPELTDNSEQQTTVIYPGGFAADIAVREKHERRVQFFNETGKRMSPKSIDGELNTHAPDLPLVEMLHNHWAVFTPDGVKLLEVSGEKPVEARLIGTTLFVAAAGSAGGPGWQQYNLRTGATGKACDYHLGHAYYIGTDGAVAVASYGNPNVGRVVEAYDLATCDALWTLRSPIGSFHDVWRVDTTLVQLSDDGTELASLVAPG